MTIKSFVLALPLVFCGWIGTLMAISALSDEAPAQMVLFPSTEFLNNLPEETSIMELSGWRVVLASSQSSFGRTLYERGALIVLPSGLRGCFSL